MTCGKLGIIVLIKTRQMELILLISVCLVYFLISFLLFIQILKEDVGALLNYVNYSTNKKM